MSETFLVPAKETPPVDQPALRDDVLRAYIQQLLAEAQLLPANPPAPAAALIQSVQNRSEDYRSWDDAYRLERALVAVYSVERLRSKARSVRAEYREIAGERAYQSYLQAKPPDPETADPLLLRADVSQLLEDLQWLYVVLPTQESERSRVSRDLMVRTMVALGAILVLGFVVTAWTHHLPLLLPVIAAGAMGGLVSVQQRLQAVPMDGNPVANLYSLSRSWVSVYIAPCAGVIGSLVLFLLFASGLVEGTLFPKIVSPSNASNAALPLKDFLQQTGPADGANLARLIVWAFIAGFSERLIPDTLDRLVARSRLEVANKS